MRHSLHEIRNLVSLGLDLKNACDAVFMHRFCILALHDCRKHMQSQENPGRGLAVLLQFTAIANLLHPLRLLLLLQPRQKKLPRGQINLPVSDFFRRELRRLIVAILVDQLLQPLCRISLPEFRGVMSGTQVPKALIICINEAKILLISILHHHDLRPFLLATGERIQIRRNIH